MDDLQWKNYSVPVFCQITDATRPLLDVLSAASEHAMGLHGQFRGRRYRRGKNRCAYCGATLDAGTSNPLLRRLIDSSPVRIDGGREIREPLYYGELP